MANEVTVTVKLSAKKGNLQVDRAISRLQRNMTGSRQNSNVQDIGTSHEQVEIAGDISGPGYVWFRNLDDTNDIEIGVEVAAAFYVLCRLEAGDVVLLRLGTATLFAKARTATAKLEMVLLES